MSEASTSADRDLPNGQAAAAILGAGIGVAALGMLALAADAAPPINKALIFYTPSGALSGVTTASIAVWLASWAALYVRWRGKSVRMSGVGVAAFALLLVGILLTFPPFMDAVQGK